MWFIMHEYLLFTCIPAGENPLLERDSDHCEQTVLRWAVYDKVLRFAVESPLTHVHYIDILHNI
jgi:hypothetical protein